MPILGGANSVVSTPIVTRDYFLTTGRQVS
jgi:hypothetical protein